MLIVTTSENYYYKWKKLPRDISQCFTNQSMIIELDVSCEPIYYQPIFNIPILPKNNNFNKKTAGKTDFVVCLSSCFFL